MKPPDKSIAATAMRGRLYATMKQVGRGRPVTITHRNSRPVVMMAADQLAELVAERDTLRTIAAGIHEIETGKTVTHRQAVRRLRTLQKSWK